MDASLDFPLEGWDLVVIGAGIGGLTCAAVAAGAGMKVLVLEKHGKLGGYAQYFGKEPTFDASTFFFPGCAAGGPADAALGSLGLWEKVERIPLEPAFRFRFPADDLLIPGAAGGFLATLGAAFPEDAEGLCRASATFDAIARALESGSREAPALLQHDRHTAHEVFAACGVGTRAEAVAAALWPFLGASPNRVDALAFAFWWRQAFLAGGVHAIRGGARAFSAGLASLVEERGGRVASRVPVARVLVEAGRAAGVALSDGRVVRAGAVVSNADPYQTFGDLLEPRWVDAATRERLDAWQPSPSSVVVHLGLPEPVEMPAQVTLLHQGYSPEEEQEDAGAEEPCFPAVAVAVSTHHDPERAGGRAMVMAMAPAAYRRPDGWDVPPALRRDKAYRMLPDYLSLKERIGERLVQRIAEVVPGVPDAAFLRRVATPITLERYTFNREGAAWGWANAPDQGVLVRPGAQTCVPGLYQCGHWTFPGSGIAAVVLSGRFAAEAILGLV